MFPFDKCKVHCPWCLNFAKYSSFWPYLFLILLFRWNKSALKTVEDRLSSFKMFYVRSKRFLSTFFDLFILRRFSIYLTSLYWKMFAFASPYVSFIKPMLNLILSYFAEENLTYSKSLFLLLVLVPWCYTQQTLWSH